MYDEYTMDTAMSITWQKRCYMTNIFVNTDIEITLHYNIILFDSSLSSSERSEEYNMPVLIILYWFHKDEFFSFKF